ncbi:MAG TPA: MarR family transcriptional regulator [Pseudonocardiaceae bacterium]|jgi:DNA-binding MarR family transcriptional regulator|nr:MarR family transcriptional regulator [Pseudonocardiaceae bacterium]
MADQAGAASTLRPPAADSARYGGSVGNAVIELLHTVRRSKARSLAADGSDVESAAQALLRIIADDGPLRASALAASVQSDLSTVSRQVATLVDRGLLERRADQRDGRASLLHVTDAGQAVIAEHKSAREAFFSEVLDGWSAAEQDQFAHLLTRFTTAYDHTHGRWLHDAPRRADHQDKPEEGTTL